MGGKRRLKQVGVFRSWQECYQMRPELIMVRDALRVMRHFDKPGFADNAKLKADFSFNPSSWAIQSPHTNGLGQVRALDARLSCKVGDGACDFQHPVIGSRRQFESL